MRRPGNSGTRRRRAPQLAAEQARRAADAVEAELAGASPTAEASGPKPAAEQPEQAAAGGDPQVATAGPPDDAAAASPDRPIAPAPEATPAPAPAPEPGVDRDAAEGTALELGSAEVLAGAVEALLFAAGEPLDLDALAEVLARSLGKGPPSAELRAGCEAAVASLSRRWEEPGRGMMLAPVAQGWAFRTRPRYAAALRALAAPRPKALSRAALETLAIVAYRQPVTRAEVEHIRGVDCGGTFKLLCDRDLLRTVGKKEDVGRPLLWGTTRAFLGLFTLGDLGELPSLREVQELSEEAVDAQPASAEVTLADLAAAAPRLAGGDEEAAARLEEAVTRLQASAAATGAALRPLGLDLGGAASEAP